MYTVEYDKGKNHINVKFIEMPYGDALIQYGKDITSAIDKTSPGFTILFDMTDSRVKFMSDADSDGAKELMTYAAKRGLKKFAYVTPRGALTLSMTRQLNASGLNPSEYLFDSVDKAEEALK